MLIDSNIIIYASKPGYDFLQDFDWITGLVLLDPFAKPPSN
jgi:hypothetical protein